MPAGQIISYNASIHKAWRARQTQLSQLIFGVDTAPTPEVYKQWMMYQTKFDLISTGQAERAMLKTKQMSYEHGKKTNRAPA